MPMLFSNLLQTWLARTSRETNTSFTTKHCVSLFEKRLYKRQSYCKTVFVFTPEGGSHSQTKYCCGCCLNIVVKFEISEHVLSLLLVHVKYATYCQDILYTVVILFKWAPRIIFSYLHQLGKASMKRTYLKYVSFFSHIQTFTVVPCQTFLVSRDQVRSILKNDSPYKIQFYFEPRNQWPAQHPK